jgi:hypothetical protein
MVGYAGRGLTVVAVSAKGLTQPATHGRGRQSEADAQWAAISKHGRVHLWSSVKKTGIVAEVIFLAVRESPTGFLAPARVAPELCGSMRMCDVAACGSTAAAGRWASPLRPRPSCCGIQPLTVHVLTP